MKGGREEDLRIHVQKENEAFLSVSFFNICLYKSTGSGKRDWKCFHPFASLPLGAFAGNKKMQREQNAQVCDATEAE